MDFRRLMSMKNRKLLTKYVSVFVCIALLTSSIFVYDIVFFAMETVQSEAVMDNENKVEFVSNELIAQANAVHSDEAFLEKKPLLKVCVLEINGQPLRPIPEPISATVTEEDVQDIKTSNSNEEEAPSAVAAESKNMSTVTSNVSYEYVTETEVIPCSYKEIPIVYAAFSGKYQNVSGKNGEKQITYKQKYVDDKLVDKTFVSEEVTTTPINGIKYVDKRSLIDYGNGTPDTYESSLRIEFTAYTYGEVGGATTATGDKTRVGYVAVDKNLIPLHSLLYIVMDNGFVYGYCEAKDVGGGIKGNRIDLFLPSYDDMSNFGRRMGTCYVVRSGR